jgi:hypothetical protein
LRLILVYHAKGKKKVNVSKDFQRDRSLKSSESGMGKLCNVESPDIIIVGAGVAGPALAYTPGEVTDIPCQLLLLERLQERIAISYFCTYCRMVEECM